MPPHAADNLASLFQPEVVLPSQFNVNESQGIGGGERKLMAAILSDGIEAFIAQCSVVEDPKRRPTYDAREWVETRDFAYVFSFDVVCECLGIDPEYLRLGLFRYVDAIRTARREGKNIERVWRKIRRPRK